MNIIEIILTVVIAAAVIAAIIVTVRKKKSGKGGCTCGCEGCDMPCQYKK